MIIFNNVNLRYGEKTVLENFCEQFEENKINCILGPSGCGKTTLLNLLAGIIKQNSGQITKPQRVSYVFQEDLLIPQQTVYKNLELVLKSVYKDKFELKAVISKFLKLSDLSGTENLYPHQMSGGMRQRIALIRAFAFKSEILLMDEPFNALDIALRDSIVNAFLDLYENDKRTVVFVSHDVDQALLTGDFIYIYDKSMKLMKKLCLDEPKQNRKLYGENLTLIKNEIYKQTEKWQVQKSQID